MLKCEGKCYYNIELIKKYSGTSVVLIKIRDLTSVVPKIIRDSTSVVILNSGPNSDAAVFDIVMMRFY
jgi:hypothetical protein